MRKNSVIMVALCCLLSSAAADDMDWVSQNGLFVVRYQSESEPPQINTLHTWQIHIEDTAGEAVTDASMAVSGGMPLHNHGLPTRPRVTAELGDGNYEIGGMRFHMAGSWEITLNITADGATDTVVIKLML